MSSNPKKTWLFYMDFLLSAVGSIFLFFLFLLGDQPVGTFLNILRLLFTILYLFFIPGYLLQLAIFPGQSSLTGLNRSAFSFVLSVALVAPVTLLLNWLPWGLSPWPITVIWFLLISILLLIALIRRLKYRQAELGISFVSFNVSHGWRTESRASRFLLGMAAFSIVVALFSGIALAFSPNSIDHFTEFYILNSSGTAVGYPSSSGPTTTLFAGIRNQEGRAMDYFVRVRAGDEIFYWSENFHIIDQAALELPLTFEIPNNGKNYDVTLELFQVDSSIAYRSLRLFVDMDPSD